MKYIRPITVTDSIFDSSNIPETPITEYNGGTTYNEGDRAGSTITDGQPQTIYESKTDSNTGNALSNDTYWRELCVVYPAYDNGVTYAADDIVTDTTNHRLFKSLQGSNTGNALTADAWWEDIGATNQWALFSTIVQEKSSIVGNAEYTLRPGQYTTAISLLGVNAESIDIIMTSDSDGEVYNQSFMMTSYSGIQDWYAYYFTPIERTENLFVSGLPPYTDADLEIFINETPPGSADVGALVIGNFVDVGLSLNGAQLGNIDYSVKSTDPDTGYITVDERTYSKTMQVDVLVETARAESITTGLNQMLNTPAVWSANDDDGATIIYGYYREFRYIYTDWRSSVCQLQIESLT